MDVNARGEPNELKRAVKGVGRLVVVIIANENTRTHKFPSVEYRRIKYTQHSFRTISSTASNDNNNDTNNNNIMSRRIENRPYLL